MFININNNNISLNKVTNNSDVKKIPTISNPEITLIIRMSVTVRERHPLTNVTRTTQNGRRHVTGGDARRSTRRTGHLVVPGPATRVWHLSLTTQWHFHAPISIRRLQIDNGDSTDDARLMCSRTFHPGLQRWLEKWSANGRSRLVVPANANEQKPSRRTGKGN